MKLTPPAPQNMKRRLKFFIKHPDYKNSEREIMVILEKIKQHAISTSSSAEEAEQRMLKLSKSGLRND